MREFLVTSECVDVRNGQRYQAGTKFPADAPAKQIERLITAGCLECVDLSDPALAGAVAAAGAVNQVDAAMKEKAAEAGRLAHGASPISEVLRPGTDPQVALPQTSARAIAASALNDRTAEQIVEAEAAAKAEADARAAAEVEAMAKAEADARAAADAEAAAKAEADARAAAEADAAAKVEADARAADAAAKSKAEDARSRHRR